MAVRSARFDCRVRRKGITRAFAYTVLTCSFERGRLGIDHAHQIVPGTDERLAAFLLEPSRECTDIDVRTGKPCQLLFAVASIRGHRWADLAVIRKGLQRPLGHGV